MAGTNATESDKHIGAAIKARRLSAGLTQSELGARIGVTFQQVQKYEKGTNRVAASTLLRIADALACPVTDFLSVGEAPPLSDSEDALLLHWRQLNPDQQSATLALIRHFATS